jgi:hypothetical protein
LLVAVVLVALTTGFRVLLRGATLRAFLIRGHDYFLSKLKICLLAEVLAFSAVVFGGAIMRAVLLNRYRMTA